jgi:hypothetical protein
VRIQENRVIAGLTRNLFKIAPCNFDAEFFTGSAFIESAKWRGFCTVFKSKPEPL